MTHQRTFSALDDAWTSFILDRNHKQLERDPSKKSLGRGWQFNFSAVAPTMSQQTQLDCLTNRDNLVSVIAQLEALYQQSGIIVGVSALSPSTADIPSEYGSARIFKNGNYHVHGYVGGFDTTSRTDVHGQHSMCEDVKTALRLAGFWASSINVQEFDAGKARGSRYLATNLTDHERRDVRYEDGAWQESWGRTSDEQLRFARKARMAAGLL